MEPCSSAAVAQDRSGRSRCATTPAHSRGGSPLSFRRRSLTRRADSRTTRCFAAVIEPAARDHDPDGRRDSTSAQLPARAGAIDVALGAHAFERGRSSSARVAEAGLGLRAVARPASSRAATFLRSAAPRSMSESTARSTSSTKPTSGCFAGGTRTVGADVGRHSRSTARSPTCRSPRTAASTSSRARSATDKRRFFGCSRSDRSAARRSRGSRAGLAGATRCRTARSSSRASRVSGAPQPTRGRLRRPVDAEEHRPRRAARSKEAAKSSCFGMTTRSASRSSACSASAGPGAYERHAARGGPARRAVWQGHRDRRARVLGQYRTSSSCSAWTSAGSPAASRSKSSDWAETAPLSRFRLVRHVALPARLDTCRALRRPLRPGGRGDETSPEVPRSASCAAFALAVGRNGRRVSHRLRLAELQLGRPHADVVHHARRLGRGRAPSPVRGLSVGRAAAGTTTTTDDSPNDPTGTAGTGGEGGDCSGFTFKVWRESENTGDAGFYQWGMLRFVHGPYTAEAFMGGAGAPNVIAPKSSLIKMDALASSGPHRDDLCEERRRQRSDHRGEG